MSEPQKRIGWWREAIFWHLYPLGFVGAEVQRIDGQSTSHRLSRIGAWLDYAKTLGVTGLLLGPIFWSETHGYDTTDHLRIDPRLGDEEDFRSLAALAHQRGLSIVLDGVFNHVSRSFGPFQDVLKNGRKSPYAEWFHATWPDGNAGEPSFAVFEGHQQLVTLNHGSPAVAAYVSKVMMQWLSCGADGWRLDAAYAVQPSFWREVLPGVRSRFDHVFIVGEVIHGDYAAIVDNSGFDSLTQYELWKAIWSSLNDANLFELKHAIERHDKCLGSFLPMTFVGNHDVTRIASQLKNEHHVMLAFVLLLTLPGIPSLYAGDEQAFRGIKEHRPGGDDAIRPAFPEHPAQLAPYGWKLYEQIRTLAAFRRARPWLADARVSVRELTTTRLVIEVAEGQRSIAAAINIGADAFDLTATQADRVALGAGFEWIEQPDKASVRIASNGWAVMERG